MGVGGTVGATEFHSSQGTNLLDHLAADGAGFAGGQVAVVALLQVDADFVSGFHLELIHSFACFGNIDLIIALHTVASPFLFSKSSNVTFDFLGGSLSPETKIIIDNF